MACENRLDLLTVVDWPGPPTTSVKFQSNTWSIGMNSIKVLNLLFCYFIFIFFFLVHLFQLTSLHKNLTPVADINILMGVLNSLTFVIFVKNFISDKRQEERNKKKRKRKNGKKQESYWCKLHIELRWKKPRKRFRNVRQKFDFEFYPMNKSK